ncbi:MAG: replicative DNA helicase [Clostridia bacterium]|nr:replicative DNA helicase [Clostridia bacterium]
MEAGYTTRESLPFNIEAEKSILGSMLIRTEAAEAACEQLKAEDFYAAKHQDIFAVMLSLYSRGNVIDSVTVIDALDRAGKLESAGGVMYITELSLSTPSAANVSHYIKIVEERSIMRRLVKAGGDISKDALAAEKTVDVMLDDAERAIFNISMKKNQDSLVHIEQPAIDAYYRMGEIIKLKGKLTGIPTPFTDLNKLTSGLQPSDLIIVAGRPSMGKTAFALNLAQHAAVKANRTVVIFSLEMSREQLAMRMLSSEANLDMQKVKTGQTDDADIIRASEALDPLTHANIYIDDTAGVGVAEVRSKCRRLKSRVGLDLIVIDYLQLMQTSGKSDNRVQEISEMTRALKIMARELNVPIILLSQLSRGNEKREGKRPMMSDLRESGAIEQDADVIILLHRPAVYDETEDNTTEVIVAKHRNGPVDTVKLMWVPQYAKFTDKSDRDE